jgi:hypothetical protein
MDPNGEPLQQPSVTTEAGQVSATVILYMIKDYQRSLDQTEMQMETALTTKQE